MNLSKNQKIAVGLSAFAIIFFLGFRSGEVNTLVSGDRSLAQVRSLQSALQSGPSSQTTTQTLQQAPQQLTTQQDVGCRIIGVNSIGNPIYNPPGCMPTPTSERPLPLADLIPITWEKITVPGSGELYKIPDPTTVSLASFCQGVGGIVAGGGASKIGAFQSHLDGKYYCREGGNACGDGTREGCRRSGCCGACMNGVLPPGVTDISQLPGLFFVPELIHKQIKAEI